MMDINEVRKDFPFFEANPGMTYLDSSATSQRPKCVIDALDDFYLKHNASPFRGLYELSLSATDAYEHARSVVGQWIGTDDPGEIVFTRNASESLNLVAYAYGDSFIHEGDEILVGITEHHSNFLPWQHLARRVGAKVRYYYCEADGSYDLNKLEELFTTRTKLLAITHMSNIFGRENDLASMAKICHSYGAVIVADGAQSVPHIPVDVKALDVDFLAFSGHKMLSPFGIGVLYGRRSLLEAMPPFLTGGEMIETVSIEKTVYSPIPQKFEAGTVNTAGAIALEAAIHYYEKLGFANMHERELALTRYLMDGMQNIPHVRVLGSELPEEHNGIVAFDLEGVHPHDISDILAYQGICVRAGHHCAQPLHTYIGVPSSTRASLMFYNTEEEIDRFLTALKEIRRMMGYAE